MKLMIASDIHGSADRALCMEGKMDARGILSNEERRIESE